MTDQLRQVLTANCDAAYESGDPKRIADAERAMNKALAECQAHSADRLKRVEVRVEKMDTTLDKINLQMTDIATSRAVLTEKYDASTKALADVRLELAKMAPLLAHKEKNLWQTLTSPIGMLFVIVLLLLFAMVYKYTGPGGVDAATSGAIPILSGGSK